MTDAPRDTINAERPQDDIESLAHIGRATGPEAPRGLCRMAFSEGDLAARRTGLEGLRVVQAQPIALTRPTELVAFSDEEGRFGGRLGSQAIAGVRGRASLDEAAELDGQPQEDALASVGLGIDDVLAAKREPGRIAACIELRLHAAPGASR